jgi:hypothetical protein
VDAYRKSLSIPVQGNRHGRLAGGIADRREGNESLRSPETLQRVLQRRIESSERHGRLGECGGEQDIILEEKSGNVSGHPLKESHGK